MEMEMAPDYFRYPTLADEHEEPTVTSVEDESKAVEEKGGLMDPGVKMAGFEVLTQTGRGHDCLCRQAPNLYS